ncbi:hypothetical protein KKF81_07285 [Candidatus Micrarchaeota archaeon]|nr:hypothetical protein [Candidatus Micrarchaeota archaeon]MBU1166732.1 hypothetical protein [Candidatus Micrarchaeota archaeon]MBU1886695.1 hypothetical protein [Candidatus Micrarchaeota archaeon]
MQDDLYRIFKYTIEFYLKRLRLIQIFSIPFILAFGILALVPAPTYMSLGGVFLRTGSIPELSILDLLITAAAYAIAVFVVADTIVNINLIVRSKRTFTETKKEMVDAIGKYATRIFYIYTLVLLLLVIVQLLIYEFPFQNWIYPIFSLLLSFLLFYVAPAVVIDHSDTAHAIKRSIYVALKAPHLILVWILIGLFCTSFLKVTGDLVFSSTYSGYFVLLVNSLIVLPFLTVLQTQMYMEKYPLAR